MRRVDRVRYLLTVAALLAVALPSSPALRARATANAKTGVAPPTTAPALVVVLVVDQMRADYITQYGRHWIGGLKRLTTSGAVFERAAYPYFNTLTCVGHATIGTGTFPHRSGIVLNEWWNRDAQRSIPCAEDETVKPVAYGPGNEPVGNGPHRLLVPTLAEQLRARPGSRVVTLSLKPRSAIMLAGHHADAVTWFDDRSLTWATSSAYSQAPLPEVQEFVQAHPVDADLGQTWSRSLPATDYRYADDGIGEQPPRGWTAAFPHQLPASKSADFYSKWEMTPYADAYVMRMAVALVDAFGLGRRTSTDFLGVSFSTLDLAGHSFGPASHEVQDVLAGLDRSLATLFDHLDVAVGRGRYVVALSADHGVAPIPEQRIAQGQKAGRIDTKKVHRALEDGFAKAFGAGRYIEAFSSGYVYLRPGVAERLKASPAALQTIIGSARSVVGVRTVLDTSALSPASPDPIVRAAALGEYAGRSGDLLVVPEPYYIQEGITATHGAPYGYDQRVPLIFMGAGIRPGRCQDPASPADVAPTLASLVGITLPNPDGQPLKCALAPVAARKRTRSR